MKIKILQLIEGARQAAGVTVVIDVFRAFSVEAYLMSGGAEKIIPVGDIQLAYQYKEERRRQRNSALFICHKPSNRTHQQHNHTENGIYKKIISCIDFFYDM